MGNRLSTIEETEVIDPGAELGYFKAIKTDRIQYLYEQLRSKRLSDFDIDHHTDTLSWADYFRIFGEIGGQNEEYEADEARRSWHPATRDLLLTPLEREPAPVRPPKGIPDDYTEDVPSDDDDDESNDGGEVKSKGKGAVASKPITPLAPLLPPNWDPQKTNPIFFGSSVSSWPEYVQNKRQEKLNHLAMERATVERAYNKRKTALDSFEAAHAGRVATRQRKIDELVEAYEAANDKRMFEFEKNERSLPPVAFKQFSVSLIDINNDDDHVSCMRLYCLFV